MKRTYKTVCMVLTIVALTVLAVGGAIAATEKVTYIYNSDGTGPTLPLDGTGWMRARVVAGGTLQGNDGAGMSRIFPKGNPSPLNVSSTYWRVPDFDQDLSPQAMWLGTKRYTGRYLSDIKTLKYKAYMRLQGSYVTSKPFYPYQPITLRLKTQIDDVGNTRYFMFRPWGVASGNLGDGSEAHKGVWEDYNCMAVSGSKWLVGEGENSVVYDNWAALVAAYPAAKLMDTTRGIAYPAQTATGCSLNFVLGAQAKDDKFLGAWWRECWNAEAAMDGFTIKFTGDTDDTVFDFHFTASNNWRNLVTDPAYAQDREYRQYYGMNNRDVKSQLIVGTHCYTYVSYYGTQCYEGATANNNGNTMANYNSAGQIIYGRVVADGYVNTERFKIDDGSGKLIPVWAPGSSAYQNDYVRVKGSLAFPQFYFLDGSMKWFPATFYSYGGLEAIME